MTSLDRTAPHFGTTHNWSALSNTFTCTQTAASLAGDIGSNAQTFIVSASGCIRQGLATMDTWNINDLKVLSNNNIAL